MIIPDWSKIDRDAEGDYNIIGQVAANLKKVEPTDFSAMNRSELLEKMNVIANMELIVEIGVENNPDKNLTSTSVFLQNKDPDTFYIGVDILDRSHLNDPSKNIYTIQGCSEDPETIAKILQICPKKIDFLFIDGWHSINQCRQEWNLYTPHLVGDGIVGFHDTNHHYGPYWLAEYYIDKEVWYVNTFPGIDPMADFGIGFAWRINC